MSTIKLNDNGNVVVGQLLKDKTVDINIKDTSWFKALSPKWQNFYGKDEVRNYDMKDGKVYLGTEEVGEEIVDFYLVKI